VTGASTADAAIILIDARHGIKENDREALDILDKAAVSYQIVLTKADKPKPSELDHIIAETQAVLAKRPAAYPGIIATSAATGLGIDLLRAEIASLAGG